MKKEAIAVLILILFFTIFISGCGPDLNKDNLNSTLNQTGSKQIYLKFYYNETNCSLDGKVYVDNDLLGNTENGSIVLNESYYKEKFKDDSTLNISGLTGSCFLNNAGLPFFGSWYNFSFLQYYFDNDLNLSFVLSFDPRSPDYYQAMQGFIRPEETRDYVENNMRKIFKNKTVDDLDKIYTFMHVSYVSDQNKFGKPDYWQTPKETLVGHEGDCEDWAILILSMFREYNPSLHCYGARWETHMSVLCYFNNGFLIYDQAKTKFSTQLNTENMSNELVLQENRIAMRSMLNNYFSSYGISADERRLYALFNEKELFTFDSNEDFVNWAVNLVKENNS